MELSFPEPLRSLTKGIEPGTITNLYGAPGTGKTNLCILAALECIGKGGVVSYIDTEGGFSLERLKQLEPNHNFAMQKINLIEPKDFEEQGKVIKSLEGKEQGLIIVDSMVSLYRLEYSEPTKETISANRELSKQLSILSNIARAKKIPVLITAHTFRNWETQENEVIGGNIIKYWSKAIIYLEKTGRVSERRALIFKHMSLPEGGSVKFMLVNGGIKPSGFKLF